MIARVWELLFPYIRRSWASVLLLTAVGAALSVLSIAQIHLLRLFLNALAPHQPRRPLYVALGVFVVLTILTGALGYLQRVLSAAATQRLVLRLRADLFDKYQRMPLEFFQSEKTGGLLNQINNQCGVIETGFTSFYMLVQDCVLLVGLVWTAYAMQPTFTLWALAVFPFGVAPVRLLGRRMFQQSRLLQARLADLNQTVLESIQGARIVRVFQRERSHVQKFLEALEAHFGASMALQRLISQNGVASSFFSFLGGGMVLYFGGLRVLDGRMAIGDLMGFMAAVGAMYGPLARFSQLLTNVHQIAGTGERAFQVLHERPAARDDGGEALQGDIREIRFEQVHFAYPGRFALRDVTLAARAGEALAVVGPSGCGKSTLVNLIPRLHDVSAGAITVNGRDIRHYSLASLRARIAVVSQELFLFADTVYNNIAYGRPNARPDEVRRAAEQASAAGFIEQLPQGFDTEVGERGGLLSEGQKQRVAIARAFLKDAPILILDEPSSALDITTEEAVSAALKNLMKGRLVFLVTHSIPMIEKADQIIVLEQGQVVASGPYHDKIHAKIASLQPAH